MFRAFKIILLTTVLCLISQNDIYAYSPEELKMIAEKMLSLKQNIGQSMERITALTEARESLKEELDDTDADIAMITENDSIEDILILKEKIRKQQEEEEALRKKKEAEDKELEELKEKLSHEKKQASNTIVYGLQNDLAVVAEQSISCGYAFQKLEAQTVQFAKSVDKQEKSLAAKLTPPERSKYLQTQIDELEKKCREMEIAIKAAEKECDEMFADSQKTKVEIDSKETALSEDKDSFEVRLAKMLTTQDNIEKMNRDIINPLMQKQEENAVSIDRLRRIVSDKKETHARLKSKYLALMLIIHSKLQSRQQ